jgi:hypothetical protein
MKENQIAMNHHPSITITRMSLQLRIVGIFKVHFLVDIDP